MKYRVEIRDKRLGGFINFVDTEFHSYMSAANYARSANRVSDIYTYVVVEAQ